MRKGPNVFVIFVFLIGMTFLNPHVSSANFNSIVATPNSIFVNTSTQVTFVADIVPSTTLIRNSVRLLRETNGVFTVVGIMNDDGTGGDVKANDNKFTALISLNEVTSGELHFQASVAYRGVLQRVQSSTFNLEVVPSVDLDVTAGQGELTVIQGGSASTAFTLQIQNQSGAQALLNGVETISPSSGLGLITDKPSGGWSTTSTNQTFLVQNTFTGNVVGDYVVTLTGTLTVGGQVKQDQATILVHVIPSGEIGQLSLFSTPGGIQTGTVNSVLFGATYALGNTTPTTVVLEEVNSSGSFIQSFGSMLDNGVEPDISAGDVIYTAAPVITAGSNEGIRYFRAVATFSGGTNIQSPVYPLPVLPFSIGFVTPDSSFIVLDQSTNQKFYCNQVLVIFKAGTTTSTINAVVSLVGGSIVGVEPALNAYQISIACNGTQGIYDTIALLIANSNVEAAEPNVLDFLDEVTPNDTHYGLQWAPVKVRADESWVIARGGTTIAVLDTGVDYNHPDLAGKVVRGFDFINWDPDPQDDHSHGTHVAGIAAASGNNGIGVAGIAWSSRILAIKVCGAGTTGCPYAAQTSGILYAIPLARILNMSLGGPSTSAFVSLAISIANSTGRLVVAAAGNSSSGSPFYPCAYLSVLCVGNSTNSDGRAGSSNYGAHVDVAAPGVNIYSTVPTWHTPSGYNNKTGTSMSSPLVAGVSALVWGRYPSWTAAQVRERLVKTGVPLPGLQIGPRVDAFDAVFNGSFEHDLGSWLVSGTGSAVPNLGPISPTKNTRMGMASTGPAGAVAQSDLFQTFIVAPGVTSIPIKFDYAMITEEYPEWINRGFNDDLRITLEGPSGTTSLAFESVDGSAFSSIGGIDFPGGDTTVGWTGWRTASFNVPVAAGGGTYRLRVRDRGDGVYDTNAVIDNIRFK